MKLSKDELIYMLRGVGTEWGPSEDVSRAEHVIDALETNTLEIEGYERAHWTRFDPQDSDTFPPKGKDLFLTLSNDGEIRSMRFDFDTALVWKHHISHWRPLPNPPIETEGQ